MNYVMKEKISNNLNVLPKGVVIGQTDEIEGKTNEKTFAESVKEDKESTVKTYKVMPIDVSVALPSNVCDLASVAGGLVNIHFHFNW